MTDQQFENFAKKYPDLFQKSGDFELSVGDGWYNLIDTLFYLISYNLETAKRSLKFAMENPTNKFAKSIPELEAAVAEAMEKLPTIDQVKEKFGGLRFYISGGAEEINNHITFAEIMSTKMCEVCGASGKRRDGGWVSTLCDAHHRERHSKDSETVSSGKTAPIFNDDE